ncbi:MAG: prepilin-type N-terminal cleavage/methylation domain-containing protein [Deltaproteobacteria bacterium]|jgi:prepilin-type N-terminal cleavage/methylation domain-containing protein|nr:prepilin-type N-terminal cleavage/methylation domain-containing protein [Deltaproteobacteria bacterium]
MQPNIKLLRIKIKGLKRKDGFTLIELIIVLAVSAILSAMVIPYAYNYTQQTEAVKTVKEMKSIADAENLFYESNTQPLACTVTVGGSNYNETELYHIYTANFSDLINSGSLAPGAGDVNYFGQNYYLQPAYSSITVNLNNYCVRQAGVLVYTYIPVEFAGAVKQIPGAFNVGVSGNWEEVGYYAIPRENNPERDAVLKYNW